MVVDAGRRGSDHQSHEESLQSVLEMPIKQAHVALEPVVVDNENDSEGYQGGGGGTLDGRHVQRLKGVGLRCRDF